MPIYEYQCSACGHALEAFQKISEAPLTECPVCNKTTLQKQVSAPAFQLKGTGWYVTDFRDKNKPEAAKTTSSKAEKPASTAAEPAPASPAAKTDEKKSDTTGNNS